MSPTAITTISRSAGDGDPVGSGDGGVADGIEADGVVASGGAPTELVQAIDVQTRIAIPVERTRDRVLRSSPPRTGPSLIGQR
jgi:hypothetical protein